MNTCAQRNRGSIGLISRSFGSITERANGLSIVPRDLLPSGISPLTQTTEFVSNPGALRMLTFVPENLPRGSALVVVLHGCGQTAAGYDHGAGWSTLASRYRFALLMPEQQAMNNADGCFNFQLVCAS
ncbi:PHB depolymerase family esterase [Bradyrhizobium jicamae]|uniref:PHB depolymerase family esterase n=1 Tax=Bradyrhizobium jicamae TaxID=280332 RepID=UPI002899B2B0|nr:PHB depolymerase family esterase [Bradyrhizobium jicamae]